MQNTEPKISPSPKVVHVAVAVIERFSSSTLNVSTFREILISKRAEHVHQGGLWEFPGGKVEFGEHVCAALARELFEELGITVAVSDMKPLIKIEHDYGDKHVLLDVFTVGDFQGEVVGKEGQPIQWVNEPDLLNYTFPDANQAILSACRLPSYYAITPEYETLEHALEGIQKQLCEGVQLLLLRQPKLDDVSYQIWVERIIALLPEVKGKLLLSGTLDALNDSLDNDGVLGVHLPFKHAAKHCSRPVKHTKLFGVSCHNLDEIKHAEVMGADFITISPVLVTATHPGVAPLGWDVFRDLVRQAKMPAYALGGMIEAYHQEALDAGAQGVAGIRMFVAK